MAQRTSYPQGFSTIDSSARLTPGRSGMGRLAQADDVLDSPEPGLDGGGILRFGVDANQGLGAAGAEEHPASVLEIELEPVVGAHTRDLDSRDLLGLLGCELFGDPLAVLVVGVALKVDVVSGVGMWPDALLEVGEDLRQRLAAAH